MNTSLIFGILGIGLTVLSIILFKRKRYPGEISFIVQECIDLFDSIVQNFNSISIKFKNRNINKDVVYLKGSFINTGDIDIRTDMVEENLLITLPEKFKWLDAKITNSSSYTNKSLKIIDNRKLEFELGLFKKNEFIQFELILEIHNEQRISSTKLLENSIKLHHRIADTKKVIKRELTENKLDLKVALSMIAVFLLISMLSFLNIDSDPTVLRFTDVSTNIDVSPTYYSDGAVKLKGIESKFEDDTTIEELLCSGKYKPKIFKLSEISKIRSILTMSRLSILSFGGVIVMIIMMVIIAYENKKNIRLRKIITDK